MSSPKIKPLASAQTEVTRETQFKHFGVLDNGQQGRGSIFTSVTVNILVAAIVCLLGAAAKKTIDKHHDEVTYVAEQPKPLPKPKPIIKVPKLPPPPEVKVAPPKINLPELAKVPEPPKLPDVKMPPAPVSLPPAPPKVVVAAAAPKVVNLSKPQAAAIANNQVAAPIRLGQTDNPIKNNTGPAVSKINLGQAGAAGMPASNSGLGAVSKVNLSGNGQPTGGTNGTGVRAVQGIPLGVPGGTGPANSTSRSAATVNLASAAPPAAVKMPTTESAPHGNPPKILAQPKPVYTTEATAKHVEGIISVRVRLTAGGSVQVLGISNDLGSGLGQSAMNAAQGIRFQPATDATGHPIDWEGIVKVTFQIAG